MSDERAISLSHLYPTGRKLCTSPHHTGPRWIAIHYFPMHKKHPDGSVRTLPSWCQTCAIIQSRIYAARPENKERLNAAARVAQRAMRAAEGWKRPGRPSESDARKRRLEAHRRSLGSPEPNGNGNTLVEPAMTSPVTIEEYKAARSARRKGESTADAIERVRAEVKEPPRPVEPADPLRYRKNPEVPHEPLRTFLEERITAGDRRVPMGNDARGRRVRAVRNSETRRVKLSTIDMVLAPWQDPTLLHRLYPDEYYRRTALSQDWGERRKLEETRPSLTHRFTVAGVAGYVTAGYWPEDGRVAELFIKGFGKEGSTLQCMLDAFGIAISISLQHGAPLRMLAKKYEMMRFDPMGHTDNAEIPQCNSILDYMFQWLELRFPGGYVESRFMEKPPAEITEVDERTEWRAFSA